MPFLQAAGSAGSTQQGLTASALPAAAGDNLPALPQSQMQPVTGVVQAADWSCFAAAAVDVPSKSLQLLGVPVSAANEAVALVSAVAPGVAVGATARPAVAIAPVAVVLAAAAVAQQALTAFADRTGAAAVTACGQEMEAESAVVTLAENLTVAVASAAVVVGQAAMAAAAVVTTVSEPGSETGTVICHD